MDSCALLHVLYELLFSDESSIFMFRLPFCAAEESLHINNAFR